MADATEQALVDAAWPYWECEGEIAKRYFETATDEDHAFYLRAQLWKELHPVDGFFNGLHRELKDLVDRFPDVDRTIDRHEYHFLLTQLTEEFNHYVMLADIFEHVMGRKITAEDTVQLAEEKKLGDIRRGYVESGDELTKAAVGFTEGGGARLFREGAKLTGGDFETKLAAAFKVIADDEDGHVDHATDDLNGIVETAEDFDAAKTALLEVSMQRLHMRNEMFSAPMSRAELDAYLTERGGTPIEI